MEPKVSDLKDERAGKVAQIKTIYEDAAKRGSAAKLTDDELKRFNALEAEIKGLDAQIEAGERAAKLLKDAGSEPAKQENNDQRNHPHISGMRDNEAAKPFAGFGEQLLAIRSAGSPGGSTDKRLLYAGDEQRAASGSNTQVGADGGFLIKPTFAKDLMSRVFETGKLAGLVHKMPLNPGSDKLVVNTIDETSRVAGSQFGGMAAYWKGEAAAYTESRPKFREMELQLRKLTGMWYATDELLRHEGAMEAMIRAAFSNVMSFYVDQALVEGTGSDRPKGFLNSAAKVTVNKEGSQAAATVVLANLANMEARLPEYSEKTAVWLANKTVKAQLMQLTLGNMPIYLPGMNVAGAPSFATLLGRPVIFTEHLPDVGTVNDICLVDPQQIYMIDDGGVEVASSIHVRFLYGEQVFRFTYFMDAQPAVNATLTAAKGSNTMSPYIVLQTRS